MPTKRKISNVVQVVDELGGVQAAAKFFNVRDTQIHNMIASNRISHRHHLKLYLYLKEHNIGFNLQALFGDSIGDELGKLASRARAA